MALEEDHNAYNPEDIGEEEDDEEESADFNHAPLNKPAVNVGRIDIMNPSAAVEDEDDDVDVDEDEDVDDSTSSSNAAALVVVAGGDADPSSLLNHHHRNHLPPPPVVAAAAAAGNVTVALPPDHPLPELKRHRVDELAVTAVVEGKKPVPIDESRRLFQRLWTDEDEIELLQGFLEYTISRGVTNSSHHHDTTAFYDQIKSKLQLDFNKNQLVEKLRRLKKKFRNVMNKKGSGKEYVFKSPHDQATFEISRKIWGGNGGVGAVPVSAVRGGVVAEEGGFDDDEANHNFSINFIDQSPNPNFMTNHNLIPSPSPNGVESVEKKTPRPRKRSRGGVVKIEDKQFGFTSVPLQQNVAMVMPTANPVGLGAGSGSGSAGIGTGPGPGQIPLLPQPPPAPAPAPAAATPTPTPTPMPMTATNLIEETVRSCLSPIFKELLNSAMSLNGPMMGSSRGFGFALSPMPLGLNGDVVSDDKWRKQQILELEVYSKRLELVQDQIKAQLEELKSMGG